MIYYCKITKGNVAFPVVFPDILGIVSQGDTLEHAKSMAKEALLLHLETVLEENLSMQVPYNREGLKDYYAVDIDDQLSDERVKEIIDAISRRVKRLHPNLLKLFPISVSIENNSEQTENVSEPDNSSDKKTRHLRKKIAKKILDPFQECYLDFSNSFHRFSTVLNDLGIDEDILREAKKEYCKIRDGMLNFIEFIKLCSWSLDSKDMVNIFRSRFPFRLSTHYFSVIRYFVNEMRKFSRMSTLGSPLVPAKLLSLENRLIEEISKEQEKIYEVYSSIFSGLSHSL